MSTSLTDGSSVWTVQSSTTTAATTTTIITENGSIVVEDSNASSSSSSSSSSSAQQQPLPPPTINTEGQPNNDPVALRVDIHDCPHAIDAATLSEFFHDCGTTPHFVSCSPSTLPMTTAFVVFATNTAATEAINRLQGKFMYHGCQLHIQRVNWVHCHKRHYALLDRFKAPRCLSDNVKCMSHVVLAVDGKTQRQVVLKRAKTDDNHKYIERELHILKQCESHSHIVQLVENELVDGWLVVEYMGGGSFETECEVPQNLTHLEVLQIAEASSKALAFLHSKNIIHRDVKPHNIFFERDEYNEITRIKLADLGIAAEVNNLSRVDFAGSKKYAAPETFQGRAGPPSDMWSWACTIAHLATGVKPYEGDDICVPYSDELKDTELPPAFHELLTQCFAPQTSERPTASEAADRCSQYLECLRRTEAEASIEDDCAFNNLDTIPELCNITTQSNPTAPRTSIIDDAFDPANYIDRQAALANSSPVKNTPDVSTYHDHQGIRFHQPAPNGRSDALVKAGADVSSHQEDRHGTPLHIAAENGHKVAIHALVNGGADVTSRDNRQWTPLHIAANNGQTDAIVTLLQAGADVSSRDDCQWTPLHLAVQNGHLNAINVLLQAGADVSSREEDQWTPLHIAANNGHTDVIDALVNAGADVSSREEDQWTPLHLAANNGHKDAIDAFVKGGADVSSRNDRQRTPLHIAANNGQTDAINALVKAGAAVSSCDDRQWTPLHLAAGNGHTDAIDALVKAGADVSSREEDQWTPLHLATNNGHTNAIDALVKAGADVSSGDEGQTKARRIT